MADACLIEHRPEIGIDRCLITDGQRRKHPALAGMLAPAGQQDRRSDSQARPLDRRHQAGHMLVDQLTTAHRANRPHAFFEPAKFPVEGIGIVARMRALEANHEPPALPGHQHRDGIGRRVALSTPPGGLPGDLDAGRYLTRRDRLASFDLKAESLTMGQTSWQLINDAAHGQIDTLECRRQPLAESIGGPITGR